MNDRFKFRVWSEEYKMYVEDNHYPIGGDYSLSMTPNGYVEVIGMGDYTDDGAFSWGTIDTLENSAGDCIVEQCTGIKDKDDTLIYEGDIVEFDGDFYGDIAWDEDAGCWAIRTTENTIYTFDNLYGYELEVIGNIHENADLLECKDD